MESRLSAKDERLAVEVLSVALAPAPGSRLRPRRGSSPDRQVRARLTELAEMGLRQQVSVYSRPEEADVADPSESGSEAFEEEAEEVLCPGFDIEDVAAASIEMRGFIVPDDGAESMYGSSDPDFEGTTVTDDSSSISEDGYQVEADRVAEELQHAAEGAEYEAGLDALVAAQDDSSALALCKDMMSEIEAAIVVPDLLTFPGPDATLQSGGPVTVATLLHAHRLVAGEVLTHALAPSREVTVQADGQLLEVETGEVFASPRAVLVAWASKPTQGWSLSLKRAPSVSLGMLKSCEQGARRVV